MEPTSISIMIDYKHKEVIIKFNQAVEWVGLDLNGIDELIKGLESAKSDLMKFDIEKN